MTNTSLRVALRVRPLNGNETIRDSNECLLFVSGVPKILFGKDDRTFTFDYVFRPDIEQEEVFDDCARPLVDKLIEGSNATILAYGQTGSGKTFSMGMGMDSSSDMTDNDRHSQGFVPRAIRKLFDDINRKKENHPSYQFEVCVSFLKLHNEKLIDLLDTQNRDEVTLRDTRDANGQAICSGVKEVRVSSPEELLIQLQEGLSCRTVASTDMNSHAIFSVILKQTKVEDLSEENKENDVARASRKKCKSPSSKIVSKLHFVDLAGSEKLKGTNSVDLFTLSKIISTSCDESRKVKHISYRDSKLTRLLRDSLGGNSQTLMLACVSPADSNFDETLNTLKYANRVRNIENKVSKCYDGNSVEIKQLREEVTKLKKRAIEDEEEIKSLKEKLQKREKEIRKLKSKDVIHDHLYDQSSFFCRTRSSQNSVGSDEQQQQRIGADFNDEMDIKLM